MSPKDENRETEVSAASVSLRLDISVLLRMTKKNRLLFGRIKRIACLCSGKCFIQRNMVTKQLNPAQLNVLSLMAYIDTEQEQQELHDILLQFYRKKTDTLLLQFQKENNISQETLDDWANQHERTVPGVTYPSTHGHVNQNFD